MSDYQEAISGAQNSANEETKSSAGDKYETGRAMAQLEIEKNMTQLAEAKRLKQTLEQIAPDKIIAELMFGFWTSLFNDRYEKELWSNLRFVFPHMPKSIRQRKNISSPLNDIRRSLRNRIYHNEPIIFNTTILYKHYSNVVQLLDWMGADLASYNKTKDRFPEVFNKMTMQLKTL